MSSDGNARQPWLFGAVPDLLWGSGLAYLFVFGLLLVAAPQVRTLIPGWAMLMAVVFVSMPHYGATLLRVYERREQRQTYALFTVYTTILLAVAFYWGIHSVLVGTVLFTLYLTWSPWHYTGQNYGITLMFLGRRGISLTAPAKRLLYISFILSYVVTFFFIHGQTTSVPYDGQRIQYFSLNIDATVADLLLFGALLGYAFALGASLLTLLRHGSRKTFPAVVLMLTQGVWFVGPAVVKNWFPSVGAPILTNAWAGYAFTWIALGHAAQYLWITTYYATATKQATGNRNFYTKALLAGCAVWTIPLLVFAPAVFGKLPYDIGLAATLAAVVNLHHFVLDGAIWKLRHSRVGGILLRKSPGDVLPPALEPAGATWKWKLVVALGVVSIAISVGGIFEREFGLRRPLAANALNRAALAAERLAWIGEDSPSTWLTLGRLALKDGQVDRAVVYLEKGVGVYASTSGWMYLGEAREHRGQLPEAIDAYRRSVALDPDNSLARMLLANAYLSSGETRRARQTFEEDERRADRGSLRCQLLRSKLTALLANPVAVSVDVSSLVADGSESQ